MRTIKPIERIFTLRATVEVEMQKVVRGKNEDDLYDLAEEKASDVEAEFSKQPHKLAYEDLKFKNISKVEVKNI